MPIPFKQISSAHHSASTMAPLVLHPPETPSGKAHFLMDGAAMLVDACKPQHAHSAEKGLGWWQKSPQQVERHIQKQVKKLSDALFADCGVACDPGFLDLVECAFRFVAKRLTQHATLSGDKRRADSFKLSQDKKVRLCLATEAALHFRIERKQKLLGISEINKCAKAIKNIVSHQEPYQTKRQLKPDGSTRKCISFGPQRYAQQLGVKWILLAQHAFSTNDYSLPDSGGHHAAAKEIGRWIKLGVNSYWIVADVKNAFPSVTRRTVRQMFDLDERLLRYIAVPTLSPRWDLTGSHTGDGISARKESPQPELPQGGAHSSVLWSAVMDNVWRRMPKNYKMVPHVLFADNIGIGAPTPELAISALSKFRAALSGFSQEAGISAGGLILHEQCLCFGSGGGRGLARNNDKYGMLTADFVEFCGYKIHEDALGEGIKYRPSTKAQKRLRQRIFQAWRQEVDPSLERLHKIAFRHWYKWLKAFPLWSENRTTDWCRQRRHLFRTMVYGWFDDDAHLCPKPAKDRRD